VFKVIAIAGSLRQVSTNKTLLKAAVLLAPEGMEITLYDGISQLPHFNPDLEYPDSVKAFQNQIKTADGLIISSPEYGHGVPGTLKNALDWLVGSSEIVNKPVALLSASTRSQIAQESLLEILKTMSAHLVLEASVGFDLLGQNKTETEIAQDPVLSERLKMALGRFKETL
jgi:chromate reductase, NAD(P)H dehydrogenase (quinone)